MGETEKVEREVHKKEEEKEVQEKKGGIEVKKGIRAEVKVDKETEKVEREVHKKEGEIEVQDEDRDPRRRKRNDSSDRDTKSPARQARRKYTRSPSPRRQK